MTSHDFHGAVRTLVTIAPRSISKGSARFLPLLRLWLWRYGLHAGRRRTVTGLANMEWETEVEHSVRIGRLVLSHLTTRYPDLFLSKQVPWYVTSDEDSPEIEVANELGQWKRDEISCFAPGEIPFRRIGFVINSYQASESATHEIPINPGIRKLPTTVAYKKTPT